MKCKQDLNGGIFVSNLVKGDHLVMGNEKTGEVFYDVKCVKDIELLHLCVDGSVHED